MKILRQTSIHCQYRGILYILLWWYPCSCTHTISMLWSIADAVSSGSWRILFKVLRLNDTICIVLLHFSSFCLCLSFVAEFSKTGTRAQPHQNAFLLLPVRRVMRFGRVVWVMINIRWLLFNLNNRRHTKRWVVVVPSLNYLILVVDL